MAKYISDILKFAYDASLHIHHPKVSPNEITRALRLTPKKQHSLDEQRRRPDGVPLDGTYRDNYWRVDLQTTNGHDLVDFLSELAKKLAPHRDFLIELSNTGGEVCCFIGVYTPSCCAHQFHRELLSKLADLGLDLRLDIYGGTRAPTSLSLREGTGTDPE